MISVAQSTVPPQSGLSQPPMTACPFFGANPTPIHFSRHHGLLGPGTHRSSHGAMRSKRAVPPIPQKPPADRFEPATQFAEVQPKTKSVDVQSATQTVPVPPSTNAASPRS